MKTIYTILLYLVCILPAWCQNNVGKADDMSRLVLTPCVVSNSSIPSYANAVVKNKLNQIVTKNGVGGNSLNQRFVHMKADVPKDFCLYHGIFHLW